ncbi:hypothetical protein QT386_03325 [Solimonas sp. SE-A11]|nr:hypothetical protein [Solimonas sp. SE-A11]
MSALLLLTKLALVPLLIALVTLAGRRWGASVAGWLSAFPVVSAPILLFVALEQGPVFAAQAATATVSAVLCILAFGLPYAWVATRHSWPLASLAGFACYFASVALMTLWVPALPVAAATAACALLLVPRLYPQAPPVMPAAARPASRADIPLRMIAAAVLVLLVTHFSARLGPQLSGLLAMFPVMAAVLAVFSHHHQGAGFTVLLLRGMVLGYWSFAAFCCALALLLPHAAIPLAFAAALATAVGVLGLTRVMALHVAPRLRRA